MSHHAFEATLEGWRPSLTPINGAVAIFDILGYQSFLESNSAADAAKIVMSGLLNLDREIVTRLNSIWEKDFWPAPLRQQWLIFSDTILLTCDLGENPAVDDQRALRELRWLRFITACSVLLRHMFDQGLPVRGVVNTGEFIVEKTCFTGTSIVDAYKLLVKLDLAACVLTKTASDSYRTASLEETDSLQALGFLFDYAVPLKDGAKTRLEAITPAIGEPYGYQKWTKSISELVSDSFGAHRKKIGPEVLPKLRNTEAFLTTIRRNNPDGFSK
jgi:hypothetical protein